MKNMQKVGKAKTTLFEDALVLGLAKEWLDVFGELPEFDVQIHSLTEKEYERLEALQKKTYEKIKN